ncbi:MAG: bifunctional DNA-formamidopyrimidine glycosylase/DNA-(apurinic or apyrimidinic site) lyase [Planctomycetes bacterium]|nr:bifunctional DNA-formamidopyrimidine glycosylase/DNA-(apurinic or apyrimidinic site) lyase [Planctomycetota bacterium]
MPELPEVETIKNDLKKKILNKKITGVTVKLARIVKNDPKLFRRILAGNSIQDIERIGKLMIARLEKGEHYLLIHLKMTGQLLYCQGETVIAGGHSLPKIVGCLPNKYSRVIFAFADGSHLFFNDLRTFGYLKLARGEELRIVKGQYGLDPLSREFSGQKLNQILKNRQTNIKAMLLDQKSIAGIGNIYADEILFAAGVKPDRRAGSLRPGEIKKIASAVKRILKKAIKYRGTTFNDYVDAEGKVGGFVKRLKVYGREGESCRRCGAIIKKMKVAGRGTRHCPGCQV